MIWAILNPRVSHGRVKDWPDLYAILFDMRLYGLICMLYDLIWAGILIWSDLTWSWSLLSFLSTVLIKPDVPEIIYIKPDIYIHLYFFLDFDDLILNYWCLKFHILWLFFGKIRISGYETCMQRWHRGCWLFFPYIRCWSLMQVWFVGPCFSCLLALIFVWRAAKSTLQVSSALPGSPTRRRTCIW